MPTHLSSRTAALTLALLLAWPATVAAQQGCRLDNQGQAGVWVSVDAGAGIALPLPTASPMQAKSPGLAVAAGVELHLPSGFGLGLAFFTKEFTEDFPIMSSLDYARHLDFLAKGRVVAAMTRFVEWSLHLALGVSHVSIKYMDMNVPDDKLTMKEHQGDPYRHGPDTIRAVTAFTSGLGTRFAVYPVDFIGIFAETTVLFAFQRNFDMELGPLTLQVVSGLEAHF